MAKTGGKTAAKSGGAAKKTGDENVKNFEQRLRRLEELGEQIRKNDIPLDEALKAFEEGITLAKTLEKDLEKIESRIEVVMNSAGPQGDDFSGEESPELELFETED